MFLQNGPQIRPNEGATFLPTIPPGIYTFVEDKGRTCLVQTGLEKFALPEALLNTNDKFISWVTGSYKSATRGFGILLTGEKGTGKTIVGKQIANNLELPTLVVSSKVADLDIFLSKIQQEVIVFIDEFDKTYPRHMEAEQQQLLKLLDGTMSFGKKLYIFTSNGDVNPLMINRPGRIRYHKHFKELAKDELISICAQKLLNINLLNDVIEVAKTLEVSSIDAVLEIIHECNNTGASPKEFMEFFNVKPKMGTPLLYELKGHSRTLITEDHFPTNVSGNWNSDPFSIGGREIGTIDCITPPFHPFKVRVADEAGTTVVGERIFLEVPEALVRFDLDW